MLLLQFSGELCFIYADYTLPDNFFGLVRPRSAALRSGRIAGVELCFIYADYTLPDNFFELVRPRSAALRSGRIALINYLAMKDDV